MDAELLRIVERLEKKLDRILEILEDELTEEEVEELNRISERMKIRRKSTPGRAFMKTYPIKMSPSR